MRCGKLAHLLFWGALSIDVLGSGAGAITGSGSLAGTGGSGEGAVSVSFDAAGSCDTVGALP